MNQSLRSSKENLDKSRIHQHNIQGKNILNQQHIDPNLQYAQSPKQMGVKLQCCPIFGFVNKNHLFTKPL